MITQKARCSAVLPPLFTLLSSILDLISNIVQKVHNIVLHIINNVKNDSREGKKSQNIIDFYTFK